MTRNQGRVEAGLLVYVLTGDWRRRYLARAFRGSSVILSPFTRLAEFVVMHSVVV
jgi:hypothetical protein